MAARTGEARQRPRRPPLRNEGEVEGEGEVGEGGKDLGEIQGTDAGVLILPAAPVAAWSARWVRRRPWARSEEQGGGRTDPVGRWAGLLGRAEAQGQGAFTLSPPLFLLVLFLT